MIAHRSRVGKQKKLTIELRQDIYDMAMKAHVSFVDDSDTTIYANISDFIEAAIYRHAARCEKIMREEREDAC